MPASTRMLTTRRKGDVGELYVASILLADPDLEVFRTMSDDGHGADLAVRSARPDGPPRWYSIQVKATARESTPCIYLGAGFRRSDDYVFAAVTLDACGSPKQAYLIPGSRFEETEGRTDGIPFPIVSGTTEMGPYAEARIHTARYEQDYEAFRAEVYRSKL